MQKSTDGVGRRLLRPRPARRVSHASRASRGSRALVRVLGSWLRGRTVSAGTARLSAGLLSALRPLSTTERAIPVAVAAIVAIASMLALLPGTPLGAAGAAQSSASATRLAVNGGVRLLDSTDGAGLAGLGSVGAGPSFQPITIPSDVQTQPSTEQSTPDTGAVTADGTLITGYAPETTVEDASSLIQTYKVKKGDTLSAIAAKYKVSTMTLWWANKGAMKTLADLHIGQLLRIPPATGLVITVAASDTLDSIAAKYGVDKQQILDVNQLTDPTLVVGQVLVIPGAYGAPIPTPKPVVKTATTSHTTHVTSHPSSGGTVSGVGGRYTGGRLSWPVVGGNNYISQYYHYGHWAIDIAADYGSRVNAAAAGKVIFAGWKSNGGGWQVWISHGSNMYTTYNHMSAISVGTGQFVGRGQQVGRIGMSGDATGPHLHFEVWIGPIWNGGQRMNPLNYL